jgi:hypothetical protein
MPGRKKTPLSKKTSAKKPVEKPLLPSHLKPKTLGELASVVQATVKAGVPLLSFLLAKPMDDGRGKKLEIIFSAHAGAGFTVRIIGELDDSKNVDFRLRIEDMKKPVLHACDLKVALTIYINNVYEQFVNDFEGFSSAFLKFEPEYLKGTPWGKLLR